MTKMLRQHLEKIHKYKISGPYQDGRCVTQYVDKTTGKLKEKRLTEEKLLLWLMDYYEIDQTSSNFTIREVYAEWIEYKRKDTVKRYKPLSEATIARYIRDYRSMIEGTPLDTAPISISDIDLEEALVRIIEDKQVKVGSYNNLFSYLSQMFRYAVRKRYISTSPMDFLDKRSIRGFCSLSMERPQIYTTEEEKALLSVVCQDIQKDPHYTPNYAILLSSMTGMRPGEIAALRWDAIRDGHIVVEQAERRADRIDLDHPENRETVFTIGDPKCGKKRSIPLTQDIEILLDHIRKLGHPGEYVFSNANGERQTEKSLGAAIYHRGRKAGIDGANFTRFRKTVSSRMGCTDLSITARSAILGHLPETNMMFYQHDVTEDAKKIVALEMVSPCREIVGNLVDFQKKKIAKAL